MRHPGRGVVLCSTDPWCDNEMFVGLVVMVSVSSWLGEGVGKRGSGAGVLVWEGVMDVTKEPVTYARCHESCQIPNGQERAPFRQWDR